MVSTKRKRGSHFTLMCGKRREYKILIKKLENARRRADQAHLQALKADGNVEKLYERYAKAEGQLMSYENTRGKCGIHHHNETILQTKGLMGLLLSTCDGWDHEGWLLKRVFDVGNLRCDALNNLHDTCKIMSMTIKSVSDDVVCTTCKRRIGKCVRACPKISPPG